MMHLSDRRRVELALPPAMLARICATLATHPETPRKMIAELKREFDTAQLMPFIDMHSSRQKALLVRTLRARAAALDWMENRTIATAYVAVVRWLQAVTGAGILSIADDAPFLGAAERLLEEIQARPENVELLAEVDRSATKASRRIHEVLLEQGYYTDHANPFAESAAA